MLRSDIDDILKPLKTRSEMRAAVKAACEAEGETHSPQGVAVWEALEGYEAFDNAKEA
jgi:hypothetical protein